MTSNQAVALLREAEMSVTSLRIWAADGLRARARSMKREGETDTINGELNIPDDFWVWLERDPNRTAEWGSGIFEATVQEGLGDHTEFRERWHMSGVTFDADELRRRIDLASKGPPAGSSANVARKLPERWQQQKPSPQQQDLFKFLGIAGKHLRDGSNALTCTALRIAYVKWHEKEIRRGKPLARTAFEKMLKRHQDGWRIEDRGWKLS